MIPSYNPFIITTALSNVIIVECDCEPFGKLSINSTKESQGLPRRLAPRNDYFLMTVTIVPSGSRKKSTSAI
jgi:hypothetical protein